jgi:hypothetical protein
VAIGIAKEAAMSSSMVRQQIQEIEEQFSRWHTNKTDPLIQLFSLRGLEHIAERFNQDPNAPPWEERSLAEKLATAETQVQAMEVIAKLADLLEESNVYRN